MSRRTRYVLAGSTAAVALVSLVAFLALHSLDQADKWASVLTLVFTAAGAVASVVFAGFGRPKAAEDAGPAGAKSAPTTQYVNIGDRLVKVEKVEGPQISGDGITIHYKK